MNRSRNPFSVLAEQAECGDTAARAKLRRQLEPEMIHIVRRVIREGRSRTVLDRRILSEARRVGLHAELDSREERERLIVAVARCVCATVVSQLHNADNRAETLTDSRLQAV